MKKRGRPRKIPESELGDISRKFLQMPKEMRGLAPLDVPTERTRANRYYADKAADLLEDIAHHPATFPEDPVYTAKLRTGIDWIRTRRTILAELGRMLDEGPSEQGTYRVYDAVKHIAERHDKLTARAAAAYVRRQRLGETKRSERVRALHHDLYVVIQQHRQRYPESTWADVLRALEPLARQIERKAA